MSLVSLAGVSTSHGAQHHNQALDRSAALAAERERLAAELATADTAS
jgi:hypothetical protein